MSMKVLILKAISFYRKYLSPLNKPSCRFTPTCSTYTYKAVERFGVIKGTLLGIWRVLRCNPFNSGGHDPVPEKFSLIRRNKR
ncbi:MAG: membrane protein insertion efficiency factor YidD [Petrotogales bacterium]